MAGYRILIIDDDYTARLITEKSLEPAGYQVICAENGVQGLSLLETQKPDLIVVDIQMPEMDGFQVLDAIRKSNHKDIPVIFLSSLDYQHLKVKALKQGADDFISKPFVKAELIARIGAVLRRTERYRRLEGIMEGDLADISLSDLLQNMELGSKTASIFIKAIDGEIYVEEGSLVHARLGRFTGAQAITRIFLLEKGSFSIKFNELPPNIPKSPEPLMSVLMNVANDVDEIKDMINRLNPDDHLVKIEGTVSEFPELESLRKHPPLSLIEMIVLMDGNPKDNLNLLIKASKKGNLRLVKKQ